MYSDNPPQTSYGYGDGQDDGVYQPQEQYGEAQNGYQPDDGVYRPEAQYGQAQYDNATGYTSGSPTGEDPEIDYTQDTGGSYTQDSAGQPQGGTQGDDDDDDDDDEDEETYEDEEVEDPPDQGQEYGDQQAYQPDQAQDYADQQGYQQQPYLQTQQGVYAAAAQNQQYQPQNQYEDQRDQQQYQQGQQYQPDNYYKQQQQPNNYQQQPGAYSQQQQQQQQQYPPEQARQMQQQQPRGGGDKQQNVMIWFAVSLCCLAVALIGLAIILTLWISDEDDETKTVTRTINITAGPTLAPTPAPTRAPTPAPIAPGGTWSSREGNTLTAGVRSGVGFGSVVGLAGDMVVAGVPEFDDQGRVEVFMRDANNRVFSELNPATQTATEQFGTAVDIVKNADGEYIMIVGAQRTTGVDQAAVSFGTAHVYKHDGDLFLPWGSVMRSPESLEEAGGFFGADVSLAKTSARTAVSSPSSSVDANNLDTGRCFIYDLVGDVWTPTNDSPLMGEAGSYFGTAIDLSDDGTRLVVGAPGDLSDGATPSAGQATLFEYDGTKFNVLTTKTGSAGESFGASAHIINADGTRFAVGGPNSGNGRGVVRVFDGNSPFEQIGSDIVGNLGEQFGTALHGKNGMVVVGTATGDAYVFEFVGNDWQQVGNAADSSQNAITSVGMGDDARSIVVGSAASDQMVVYDFVGA